MLQFIPPIIAHRGASGSAPENTLAAFKQAKQLGINWVEFDVMLAACGELVVFHDDTLERTTNGQGLVLEHTYQQLQQLDAGSWFDRKFIGEKIPAFSQVLPMLDALSLQANIEIKPFPGTESAIVKKLLAELPISHHFLLSSFSLKFLRLLRDHSTQLRLGLLMDDWLPNWLELSTELVCQTVNVNYLSLTKERVKQIKESGRLALAYTVNDAAKAKQLYEWGIDAVFVDV